MLKPPSIGEESERLAIEVSSVVADDSVGDALLAEDPLRQLDDQINRRSSLDELDKREFRVVVPND